ncbi:PREDICTED: uncharacterized protein LOC106100224 isoform X2 [Papilio polytes]|uniref:uncharacterized protein LOC106100224 isoform X2 n=1 Tax=Papilio polytes TaxID=76194 RepID=UPI00067680F7|nr:PREDICTED: uncharacterized protein LOC106100224 isoform X2 [Papilio polytes]
MDWSTCSPDIILMLFKYLDSKSLVNCFSVCKSWRDLVDYHAGVKGIWPDLAQLAIYNKGIAFKQRSLLPWRDLYFNKQLWINGNVHIQFDTILELNQFKHMHVFEDNITVIIESGMKQYKVDTLVKTLEENGVQDYQKTHCVTGKLVNGILTLNIGHRQKHFSINCCAFILIENRCFTIDVKNALILIKISTDNVMHDTLMRSYDPYGSICSINIYFDDVYVLKRNGSIIRADSCYMVTIIGKIDSPHFYNNPSVMCLFLKHSVIYSVRSEDGSKSMKATKITDTEEIVVECSGLSCATPHSDLLFLGYEDGEVRGYLPKRMLQTNEPLFTFNIKDIVKCNLVDAAVKAIEVYEANESHYLFIATKNELIKVVVTHN